MTRGRSVRGPAALAVLLLAGLVVPSHAETPAYAWSLVSATAPPATMHPGQKVALTVAVRNEGTAVWSADGETPVRLGATAPRERVSAFASADPSWLDGGRRIRMTTPEVPPGGTAVFAFTFTAPVVASYPASFDERFAPVAEDLAWMDDDTISFATTVRPVSSNVPPLPNPPIPEVSPPPVPSPPAPVESCLASPSASPRDVLPPGAAAGYEQDTVVDGLTSPRAVALDPLGRVLVATPTSILRLDASGVGLGSFGEDVLSDATGVAVTPTGRVVVSDAGTGSVEVFSIAGIHLGGFAGFEDPQSIAAVDGGPWSGSVVVSDAGAAQVVVASVTGEVQAIIGGPDVLSYPTSVAVYGGSVWVADTGHDRLVRFSFDGAVENTWGGPDCLDAPQGVAVSAHGVYIADTGNARVLHTTRSGIRLAAFGDHALRGIALDAGTLYAADPDAGAVRRFVPAAHIAPPVPCPAPCPPVP